MGTPLKNIRYRERRKAKRDLLPKIPCACGCGALIPPVTADATPMRYMHGHNPGPIVSGRPAWNKGLKCPQLGWNKGKKLTADQIARRDETRRRYYGGRYTNPSARGWTLSEATRQRIREANLRRNLSGANNPAWEGGKSFEPYPAEFNRALKRRVLVEQGHCCADCSVLIGRRKHAKRANVHHMDGNKQNCDRSNLVGLCVPCHSRRHWTQRKQCA